MYKNEGEVNLAGGIKIKILREQQFKEEYTRVLKSMLVGWDEISDVKKCCNRWSKLLIVKGKCMTLQR